ncbi:DDE-type integrase/transposase/recombinase [Nakamurella sp. A5-74]|uniref:DDE-type integrase/transposase/recombinase n=1 Tax=Nakamurella sp. A5-74 TaxID=3158264 RepID=A0AAU8DUZ3_9ACTN
MSATFTELHAAQVTTKAACALIGRPRASHYRQRADPILGPKQARRVPDNGQVLTAQERAAVLTLINTKPYADLAIGQIWARELDEGRYLCSMSSMYRIARNAGQTRERRRQATHPPEVKPELMADAPSQVWSWDITKLRGPAKGTFYHLYVLIDIYSRYNPGWLVSTCEESNLAADFIADAIGRNGTAPHSVHADRGTSMTSKPVSMLLTDLGVTRSHSRPHVSNDNPYSEAQYRTLKYLPDFPDHFESLEHAKQFCTEFFHQYNYIHRHSGIGWHTPSSVHFGTADAIDDARQTTLTTAYHATPARFGRRPHPPRRPEKSWINQPPPEPPK